MTNDNGTPDQESELIEEICDVIISVTSFSSMELCCIVVMLCRTSGSTVASRFYGHSIGRPHYRPIFTGLFEPRISPGWLTTTFFKGRQFMTPPFDKCNILYSFERPPTFCAH